MTQIAKSQADHQAVVGAIQAGEDGAAEDVLARHVYNSYGVFTEGLGGVADDPKSRRLHLSGASPATT